MSRRLLLSILVALVALGVAPRGNTDDIQGSLEVREGQRILRLWGTHEEMGYAHGNLLAEEIVLLIDNYFIGTKWNATQYESSIRPYVENYFVLPTEYEQELTGMLDGITDSGVSTYLASVGRELDFLDLHATNLWGDFTSYLCSSISAWGEMTIEDSVLAGGTAMGRNFDYPKGPGGILPMHSLLIAYSPSSPGEKPWVSIAWPGFVGCLSGMNVDGIVSATDGGRCTAPAAPDPHTLIGHLLTVRDAIEDVDENGDSEETIDDIIFATARDPRLGGLLTHVASPFEPWQQDDPAVCIEMDSYGYALRYGSHNMIEPFPIYSDDCLAVANHCRVYIPADTENRYAIMRDSLNTDLKIDTEELWQIEGAISFPTTLHAILFRPNLMDLFVAFGDSAEGAYGHPRVHWTWDDLFPGSGGEAAP